jgi:cell division septation protein DedD
VRQLPQLLFAAALAAACSRGPTGAHPPLSGGTNGPDAVLIRLVATGGTARAYRWGSDSVLWSSPQRVTAVRSTLAFDDAQGSLAYADARGVPGRLDLRVGSASAAATTALTGLTSADGWAIYGITPKRDVSRLTPSGTWTFTPEPEPRGMIPLPDGSLILLNDNGNRHELRRLHPPEPRVTETTSVPHSDLLVRTELGDRLYFIGDSGVAGVRTRDLTRTKTVWIPGQALDAVATPSGDRIFVAIKGKKSLTVIDRFAEEIAGTIDIGGTATALRIDPDGRYLLARIADGDSVRVIAIGTSRAIGTVQSHWRADLPLLGPDGGLAVLQDTDVVIIDAESHKERARFLGGAADVWTLVRWNGFRPRAKGLDVPVNFDSDSDSTAMAADSAHAVEQATAAAAAAAAAAASAVLPAPGARPQDAAPRPPDMTPQRGAATAPGAAKRGIFTLSFAALLSEDRARTLAASITVDGHPVRVVPGISDRTPVYRVVYGPFDTKEDADRAGRRTGLPYWVYEGAP